MLPLTNNDDLIASDCDVALERKLPEGDFPPDFVVQKIRHKSVSSVSRLTGPEIAAFFRQNSSTAKELLVESYDKRFSPSTFSLRRPTNTVSGGSRGGLDTSVKYDSTIWQMPPQITSCSRWGEAVGHLQRYDRASRCESSAARNLAISWFRSELSNGSTGVLM